MASTFVKVYCFASAIFFAFCAYAQSNDPNPEWWIAGYLAGGCALNATMLLKPGKITRNLTRAFAVGSASFVIWWLVALLPKLDYALDIKSFAWSFLEFEEGREIGGLVILLLHVLKLLDFQRTDKSSGSSSSSWLGTIVVLVAISGAVYLWAMYQPDMNMRENMEHCAGVFQNTIFSSKVSSTEEL